MRGASTRLPGDGVLDHTPPEPSLRERGATTIDLEGVATNLPVHATARDAPHAGFRLDVLADAAAAHSTEAHGRTIEDIRSFNGHVTTVADLEHAWGRSRTSVASGA